jgi:hypothetical protein
MAFVTELTLEDLLAEPMVVAVMRRDGVSIGQARALYDNVALRLKDRSQASSDEDRAQGRSKARGKRAQPMAAPRGRFPWMRGCQEPLSPMH